MLIARQGHDSCASRKWIENNTHPHPYTHEIRFSYHDFVSNSWQPLVECDYYHRGSVRGSLWHGFAIIICVCVPISGQLNQKQRERRKENKRTIREEIERKLCQKRKGNPTGTTPSSSCVMCGIYPSRFHPSWCDKSRNANERSMVSFFKNISQLLHSLVIVWSDPKDACIIIGSVRGSMCFVTFFFLPLPPLMSRYVMILIRLLFRLV